MGFQVNNNVSAQQAPTQKTMSIEELANQFALQFKSEGDEQKVEKLIDNLNILNSEGLLSKVRDKQEIYYFLKTTFALNKSMLLKEIYAVPFPTSKGTYSLKPVIDYHEYIKAAQLDPEYNGYSLDLHFQDKDGNFLPKEKMYCVFTATRKSSPDIIFKNVVLYIEEDKFGNWKSPVDMIQKAAIKRGLARMYPNFCANLDAIEQSFAYKELNNRKQEAKVIEKEKLSYE